MTRCGFARLALGLVLGPCLGLVLLGCGPYSRSGGGVSYVGNAPVLPVGTWQGDLYVPHWLELEPTLLSEVRAEVASVGVPQGWRVAVMDPGQFSYSGSRTGLAMGTVAPETRTVYCAWRYTGATLWASYGPPPALPALAHEVEHVRLWIRDHDASGALLPGRDPMAWITELDGPVP